ncbi:hypothetical protein Syun_009052 [Stephania yunnanensis]|uniref:Uncharacterized protein n=1 Tax=Stephania yunnanensis TaxID=152371 RepID=A0AAP0PN51_9MAGN
MGSEAKALVLCVVLLIWLVVSGGAQPQVPCYFIFGDSLIDNGNNNGIIVTLARANYLPYGIDFPGGPTGRFSNGVTTVDVIEVKFEVKKKQNLLGGVNFASAAAGIRDETGQQLGGRITFNGQIRNYQNAFAQIVSILGNETTATDYLSRCIFTVGMGSNDYLNNYFMPLFYSSSVLYTPVQFADILIQQYSQQLRTLYDYGARKVALIGLGQIGCSPNSISTFSPNSSQCVERINSANRLFNDRLRSFVENINNNLPGAKFTYLNAYDVGSDILRNPSSYGITVTNRGCCGLGRNNGQITCLPLQIPCKNRDQYFFWDAFHPGAAANKIIGRRYYSAQSPTDAYPIDIRGLAQL